MPEEEAASRSAGVTERFVELPGARVRVLERPGAGPTVLFLHGITSSAQTWRPYLGSLPAGLRGVAFDLLGNGYTDLRGPRRPLTIDDLARQTEELTAELEVDGFAGVGHSMGCAPLLRLAWQQPRQVRGLLLEAPTALGRAKLGAAMRAARFGPTARLMERFAPRLVESEARKRLEEFAGQSVSEEMLEREAGHARARPVEQARGFIDLIGHGDPRRPAADVDRYERIECPVWVLRGAEDRDWMPEQHEDRYRALIPGARLLRWEGIGHAPHIQAPRRFAELLGEFLDSAVS